MPKTKPKLTIHLDLLKPQSNPEKITVKLLRWLLSSGRYLFVVVNALVLIAFGTRFKMDADLVTKKEAIEEQIPYVESLKPYEILIRETQLKLSTIDNIKTNSLDWPATLKKIADQTPVSVTITSISIKKDVDAATLSIAGQTKFSRDLTDIITGLKEEKIFSNVNLTSVESEEESINFTVSASVKLMNYSAAELTEYPSESSSVNHSFPRRGGRYSGSRINYQEKSS
ncbi:hypothetical protein A3J19_01325 [Candidatus Daviesbacteria bacterium RIFCSPLOWO2_02_FULL_41_8]|uniref:Uncharacterized protein n=3 Tax=Candidatus Daviesiibacteriota TaxID=1752718 RepID=A0A1F5NJ26_9BACT|nr:MAG: hypothetical protein A2871_03765 [Candidatus Daviesbacteria bacterium RIFCSPHIGHO2_01_FULL_41_23]OGE32575.1 MAG: hypothetical protein A3D83_03305 [Candidatus Daviesbacteria bacterium RIFCSPHIGHO2_02_FULL_41_10]OGE62342.1 MAG: hypothetical protein A2967_02710 [Candidatus Daviesbacteria bacterium RIFCSPLOWO2_01_FULL_41_32]OGE77628.1 MAG: hypothetical protein A3J19_01325 [Candidatus Daviesbacteria bacterium RIFCSPLOWO2_02_FULL_41_8]